MKAVAEQRKEAPPASPYVPPVEWGQIQVGFQKVAAQRRDALADILTHHRAEPIAQLLGRVRPAWRAVFGPVAAARLDGDRLRYIVDRTIRRDNGCDQFYRAELYLDEAAFHGHAPTAESIADQVLHKPLLSHVEECNRMSAEDKARWPVFFDHIFRHHEGLLAQAGERRRRVEMKRSLLDWLLAVYPCPTLARTAKALRRMFDRDLRHWQNNGRTADALYPAQEGNSGRPPHVCEPCWAKVNAKARTLRGRAGTNGNTGLAYRSLRKSGELCAACCGRFKFDLSKNKSTPVNIRRNAAPNALEIASDRGKQHALSIGPKTQCTWDDVDVADYYVIDDWTPGHLAHTQVDGQTIFGMVQIIEVEDLKTSNPLGYVAYFGPPNSLIIRRLYHRVFTQGPRLPHIGLLHEHGAFAARLTRGEQVQEREWNPWHNVEMAMRRHYGIGLCDLDEKTEKDVSEEREMGLSQPGLGLRVRHSIRPWTKPIEGSFHIRQALLSGAARGFVGFQQRYEMPDHLADFARRVKAGKEDPNQEFPSLDELIAAYDSVCDEYRHEPQPGSRRLKGASPFQAWSEGTNRRPLRELLPEMQYAISTHRLPMELRPDGLTHSILGTKRVWADRQLGEWYGRDNVRDVIGYWHIENPHLLTVTTMNGKKRLTLRALTAPRFNAPRGQVSANERMKRDYISAATTRFSGIEPKIVNVVARDSDASEEAKALGRHINEAVETESKVKASSASQPRVNRLAAAYGIESSTEVTSAPAGRIASDRTEEIRARLAAKAGKISTPSKP